MSTNMCTLGGGCKSTDKIWGVVNTKNNTLHRLTFSKDLADVITNDVGGDYSVKRFAFELRAPLTNGERSPNGLYAIVSALKKDLVLRVGLIKETAEMMVDDTRYLSQVSLTQIS